MKQSKSKNITGIRGWLLLLALIVGLATAVQITHLLGAILSGNIKTILNTLLLVIVASTALTLLLLKKRAAKIAYIVFIIVFPISGLLVRVYSLHESVEGLMSSIVFVSFIVLLVLVYFLRSKRVQDTLVN